MATSRGYSAYLLAEPCPHEKRQLRRKIQKDVDRYLSRGGEIEQFPDIEERPDYARPVFIHKEGMA